MLSFFTGITALGVSGCSLQRAVISSSEGPGCRCVYHPGRHGARKETGRRRICRRRGLHYWWMFPECNAVLQFTIHIEPGGFTVVGIDDRIPLAFLMNSPGRVWVPYRFPGSSGAGYRRAPLQPFRWWTGIIEAQGIITGIVIASLPAQQLAGGRCHNKTGWAYPDRKCDRISEIQRGLFWSACIGIHRWNETRGSYAQSGRLVKPALLNTGWLFVAAAEIPRPRCWMDNTPANPG